MSRKILTTKKIDFCVKKFFIIRKLRLCVFFFNLENTLKKNLVSERFFILN